MGPPSPLLFHLRLSPVQGCSFAADISVFSLFKPFLSSSLEIVLMFAAGKDLPAHTDRTSRKGLETFRYAMGRLESDDPLIRTGAYADIIIALHQAPFPELIETAVVAARTTLAQPHRGLEEGESAAFLIGEYGAYETTPSQILRDPHYRLREKESLVKGMFSEFAKLPAPEIVAELCRELRDCHPLILWTVLRALEWYISTPNHLDQLEAVLGESLASSLERLALTSNENGSIRSAAARVRHEIAVARGESQRQRPPPLPAYIFLSRPDELEGQPPGDLPSDMIAQLAVIQRRRPVEDAALFLERPASVLLWGLGGPSKREQIALLEQDLLAVVRSVQRPVTIALPLSEETRQRILATGNFPEQTLVSTESSVLRPSNLWNTRYQEAIAVLIRNLSQAVPCFGYLPTSYFSLRSELRADEACSTLREQQRLSPSRLIVLGEAPDMVRIAPDANRDEAGCRLSLGHLIRKGFRDCASLIELSSPTIFPFSTDLGLDLLEAIESTDARQALLRLDEYSALAEHRLVGGRMLGEICDALLLRRTDAPH